MAEESIIGGLTVCKRQFRGPLTMGRGFFVYSVISYGLSKVASSNLNPYSPMIIIYCVKYCVKYCATLMIHHTLELTFQNHHTADAD